MITQSVAQYIGKHHLLDKQGIHLVALSGGADSVALLLVLRDLGYDLHATHCNFHLRGNESDRDEQFCVQICEKLGVPLHRAHFDTHAYAEAHHVSIEMAARELRYQYFRQLKDDIKAKDICVAHHRDDQAETVLMNLMRGAGVQGLTGMAPLNDDIARPLLCVSRQEIEAYLQEKGQDYVTDSTNLVADVNRNKIRLQVIPQMEKINPATKEHIARTAEYMTDVRDFAEEQAEKLLQQMKADRGRIELKPLLSVKGYKYLIFLFLSRRGFNSFQVAEILSSLNSQGKLWTSSSHECTIDRGGLLCQRRKDSVGPLIIPEPGNYRLNDSLRYSFRVVERATDTQPSKNAYHATIDAEKARFPLTLRLTENGDRFTPYGMKGSKLVSDYLTNRKRTLFQKRDQLVLADATGRILWLVGERIAQGCAISESTRQVLHIEKEERTSP